MLKLRHQQLEGSKKLLQLEGSKILLSLVILQKEARDMDIICYGLLSEETKQRPTWYTTGRIPTSYH